MNAEMLSGNGSRNRAGFPSPHRMPVEQTVNNIILTNGFMMIVIFVAIGYGIPIQKYDSRQDPCCGTTHLPKFQTDTSTM